MLSAATLDLLCIIIWVNAPILLTVLFITVLGVSSHSALFGRLGNFKGGAILRGFSTAKVL